MHYMWIGVWSKKWQCGKLSWIKTHFNTWMVNISIILNNIVILIPLPFNEKFQFLNWSITQFFNVLLDRCFWNSFARLMSYFCVVVYIAILFSYTLEPVNCAFTINMGINRLSVAFMPSTTSQKLPGMPTTLLIMIP